MPDTVADISEATGSTFDLSVLLHRQLAGYILTANSTGRSRLCPAGYVAVSYCCLC